MEIEKYVRVEQRIMEAIVVDNRELKALADERLKLLGRCKFIMDVCGADIPFMSNQLDSTLYDELEKELAKEIK